MDSLTIYLYFLITVFSDLTFLHAGITPRCDATVDKHFDGYCSLQYLRRGSVELFYDKVRQVVKAPAFWTCYPGPHIRFHAHQDPTWYHSYVAMRGPALIHLQQGGLLFRGVQNCPPRDLVHRAAQMDRIIKLIHTPGPLSFPRAANLLESLLLDLAEQRRLRPHAEPWLEKLFALLETDSSAHLDYAVLAKQFGMALSTLRRRFHEETGIALHRHVLELRVARARDLVGSTELPLKKIAELMGYENLFYFSRQFRRFHGVPPSAYRRSRQG